ncbi:hypothetical protein O0235_09435 [Tepidiforma flava]|uniref:Enoyl-CoA hydratase/isomerase family protein n=1 Tax=Tepidiforma flava TaxID=3004094 RepID=A0ABY7M2Y9_9CHLR|nr:hypothetical protein [Tepidiforma flava]WBL35009.1 hypothetical protein O0235_09435 [Tepidiforma flava]
MEYTSILYEVEDRVATITLNKPERLNAFDDEMLAEWAQMPSGGRTRTAPLARSSSPGRGGASAAG